MTPVNQDELLPCPFCGAEAELLGTTTTLIRCSNEECISLPQPYNNYGHRADAIAAWNTRISSQVGLIEALEAARDHLDMLATFSRVEAVVCRKAAKREPGTPYAVECFRKAEALDQDEARELAAKAKIEAALANARGVKS